MQELEKRSKLQKQYALGIPGMAFLELIIKDRNLFNSE